MTATPTEAEVVVRLRAAGCVFAEEEARLLVENAGEARLLVANTGEVSGALGTDGDLEAAVARRVAGEPLEQILGWAEFAGLRIALEPGVFVPRQRTLLLVELAVELATDLVEAGGIVVDLCCGAGAIGAAVAASAPGVEVYAADIDPAAVRAARRNLPPERVFEGDLYAALPTDLRGRVAVLTVNAPYVPTDDIALMPPEARDHEHRVALDGGADGLDVQRRVAADAAGWLAPGGSLLIETSERQASATAALLRENGLATRIEHDDERWATVVIGAAPA